MAKEDFSSKYNLCTVPLSLISRNDYDHIIAYIGSIDKEKLPILKKLQWLQIPSHGANGFDNENIYGNNFVKVTRSTNIYAEPISQYCITAFWLYNTYAFRKNIVSNHSYNPNDCQIIDSVKIAIFGLGNIGMCLAKKCHHLNWIVWGVKKHIKCEKLDFVDKIFTLDSIKEKLNDCDYIVNLLPEAEDTMGIYDYSFFKLLKKTAIFCNVGRASAVIEQDLVRAIDEGIIRGAILDVSSKIKSSNNIIVTNHISWKDSANDKSINKFFSQQLLMWLNGEKPLNEIVLE